MPVAELILAYLRHAENRYRKDGEPTHEVGNIKLAPRPLRRVYGATPARDFGPLARKSVHEEVIRADLCRREVNKWARHATRKFRWATEKGWVEGCPWI